MFVCKIDQSHLNQTSFSGSSCFRKSQWMKGRDKIIEELGYELYQICQHIKLKDGQHSVISITFLFHYTGEQHVTI